MVSRVQGRPWRIAHVTGVISEGVGDVTNGPELFYSFFCWSLTRWCIFFVETEKPTIDQRLLSWAECNYCNRGIKSASRTKVARQLR